MFLLLDLPKFGCRLMQSFNSRSPTLTTPHISVLQSALSKDVIDTVDAIGNRSNLMRHISALSITNNNVIIPDSIRPPGLNQSPVVEPENGQRRSDIETPLSAIIKEISEKNLDIMPSFDLPPIEGQNESIEAAVMIQIRKRKMRKHKLRKLRKRMRYEWAKVAQRRFLRKEKEFHDNMLNQIREAEKFSAEEYVSAKLTKFKSIEKVTELERI